MLEKGLARDECDTPNSDLIGHYFIIKEEQELGWLFRIGHFLHILFFMSNLKDLKGQGWIFAS